LVDTPVLICYTVKEQIGQPDSQHCWVPLLTGQTIDMQTAPTLTHHSLQPTEALDRLNQPLAVGDTVVMPIDSGQLAVDSDQLGVGTITELRSKTCIVHYRIRLNDRSHQCLRLCTHKQLIKLSSEQVAVWYNLRAIEDETEGDRI
jgi:hypothetical protein